MQDDVGNPTNWGNIAPELLYGPEGWCEAKKPIKACALSCLPGALCDRCLPCCCTCSLADTCLPARTEFACGNLRPEQSDCAHCIFPCWLEHTCGANGSAVHGRCVCVTDGQAGPTCDVQTETVCNNQCSGHGDCWLGFCSCHAGYWGHDCAHRDPTAKQRAHAGDAMQLSLVCLLLSWPARGRHCLSCSKLAPAACSLHARQQCSTCIASGLCSSPAEV